MAKKTKKTKAEVKAIPVSAPVPKPVDGRPSLADARKQAKAGLKAEQTGTENPGAVANKEPGLQYYYWDALELTEEYQEKLRIMFAGRGYWKTKGAEYVPNVPHAEIWATYDEVYKEIRTASKKRWLKLKRSLSMGK